MELPQCISSAHFKLRETITYGKCTGARTSKSMLLIFVYPSVFISDTFNWNSENFWKACFMIPLNDYTSVSGENVEGLYKTD